MRGPKGQGPWLTQLSCASPRPQAISVALHGTPWRPFTRALSLSGAVLVLALLTSRALDVALAHFEAREEAQRRAKRAERKVLTKTVAPEGDVLPDDMAGVPLVHTYLTRPGLFLVWTTAASAVAALLLRAAASSAAIAGQSLEALIYAAWQLALVSCLSWGLVLYSGAMLEHAALDDPGRAPTLRMLHTLLARAVAAVAAILCLGVLRVPLSALLTFGGVGGVLIGVGAREIASNAAAGISLQWSHFIREGDFIVLVGKDISGTVVELSLTTATLLCADATRVTLPNAQLGGGAVRNLSRRTASAVTAEYAVNAAYAAKLPSLCRRLERFLASHPGVSASTCGGVLTTAVTLSASSKHQNALTVTLTAYVETQGRTAAEVERVKREVLIGVSRLVLDSELALAQPVVTAVLPIQASTESSRQQTGPFRRRALFPRTPRKQPGALPAETGLVGVDDPEGFAWRTGELEQNE